MSSPDIRQPAAESLERLQAVLLELLIELDRVCRSHGIEYTLSGGTLLGAVRHGGFIPWDDDVDVSMRRSEYIRFRDACLDDLDPDRFFFQDHTTDPEYPWGYARLRRKNSAFVRIGQEHMKMRTGIFLDIFPIDYIPQCYPLRLLHCFACFSIRKMLYAESGKKSAKTRIKRTFYGMLDKIPRSAAFYCLGKLIMSKKSAFCRALTFPQPKDGNLGVSSEFYDEYEDIKFAGHSFRGMKQRLKYLKLKYGEYMRLPPPGERHWHPVAVLEFPPRPQTDVHGS